MLLYINDLSGAFNNLNCVVKLYADDAKLYRSYKLGDCFLVLVKALDHLTEWAKLWQFRIANIKCIAHRVSTMKMYVNCDYAIDGYKLQSNCTIHFVNRIVHCAIWQLSRVRHWTYRIHPLTQQTSLSQRMWTWLVSLDTSSITVTSSTTTPPTAVVQVAAIRVGSSHNVWQLNVGHNSRWIAKVSWQQIVVSRLLRRKQKQST